MKLQVLARFVVIVAMLCSAAGAGAQQYPGKPVRLIVPFAPGGSTDIMARLLGQRLGDALGQQIVVDNRGGAGTMIGTEIAAKSASDGYTLLVTNIAYAINPGLHSKKLSYDPHRDFAPITLLASQPTVLAVHPSLPVRSVSDLVKLAKQKPGGLTFASAGTGSVGHIAGEMFKLATGVDMIHVPYKGGGPAVIDLVAGQVVVAFIGMPTTMTHAKAGKVRIIAVTDGKRPSAEPRVPTIAESGVADYQIDNWIGMLAPAGTPHDIIARLHGEIARILQQSDIREKLASQGFEVVGSSPAEFKSLLVRDIEKFSQVIRQANIRLN
ncbi:MAG: tripartite tricarboxylate transporter substrate binding protein [Burkholderiales bacterium]|nr:tripartite tricarboxylate transporter substrate binding protein [Burkholderiales bacterium]